jgi:hypothetical protein
MLNGALWFAECGAECAYLFFKCNAIWGCLLETAGCSLKGKQRAGLRIDGMKGRNQELTQPTKLIIT